MEEIIKWISVGLLVCLAGLGIALLLLKGDSEDDDRSSTN